MKLKKDLEQSKILNTHNSKNSKETKKEKIERLWKIRREEEFSDWEVVRKRLNI